MSRRRNSVQTSTVSCELQLRRCGTDSTRSTRPSWLVSRRSPTHATDCRYNSRRYVRHTLQSHTSLSTQCTGWSPHSALGGHCTCQVHNKTSCGVQQVAQLAQKHCVHEGTRLTETSTSNVQSSHNTTFVL